jgi:hypothetical protein
MIELAEGAASRWAVAALVHRPRQASPSPSAANHRREGRPVDADDVVNATRVVADEVSDMVRDGRATLSDRLLGAKLRLWGLWGEGRGRGRGRVGNRRSSVVQGAGGGRHWGGGGQWATASGNSSRRVQAGCHTPRTTWCQGQVCRHATGGRGTGRCARTESPAAAAAWTSLCRRQWHRGRLCTSHQRPRFAPGGTRLHLT